MDDRACMEANRRDWDRRVAIHQTSDFNDVDAFRAGRSSLRSVELDLLGDVADRSLLHLQCHFGMDTLSLACFLGLGGTFVIVEDHPIVGCVEEVDGRLEAAHSIFPREANEFVSTGTYTDPAVRLEPIAAYEWSWTVAGLVSALLGAGLLIERLRELPVSAWQCFLSITLDSEGWWRLPGDPLPLLVACRATKPAS